MIAHRFVAAILVVALLGVSAGTAEAGGWSRDFQDRPLRVVTQNLYVGG